MALTRLMTCLFPVLRWYACLMILLCSALFCGGVRAGAASEQRVDEHGHGPGVQHGGWGQEEHARPAFPPQRQREVPKVYLIYIYILHTYHS